MPKRLSNYYGLVLLLLCMAGRVSNNYGATIMVTPGGRYSTISTALAAAKAGDTIQISKGVYTEYGLKITVPLTLVGKPGAVIDGGGKGEVITVLAGGTTITGVTIQRAGVSYLRENAGVRLEGVANCSVTNNTFNANFFGVYCANSSGLTISGNRIKSDNTKETSSGNGIHLWKCRDVTISNNTVHGHRDGIYFEFVRHGEIHGNRSTGNLRYGLHFMFSDSCRYKKNYFSGNGAGVAVMYTSTVVMTDNIFERQWGPASYGLLLKDISDSRIEQNTIYYNTTGLYMEGCNRTTVTANRIERNGWGIKLMANSMNNVFTANAFLWNSYDVSTNSRQSFNTFTKNYWSAYSGYDLNRDGTGDVPFHPVTLFSILTEQQGGAQILFRSFFAELLNAAERAFPSITPDALRDDTPLMKNPL